jgi:anti-sigma factor RsiW
MKSISKCVSEELLALYIEGDLPQVQAALIANHIDACDVCSVFAAELRESQAVLKSIQAEPVTAAALASVRTGVFREVERVEKSFVWLRLERLLWSGFRRRYALAGFAIAMITAAVVWHSSRPSQIHTEQITAEPVQVAAAVAEDAPSVVAAPPKVVHRGINRTRRAKPNPPTESTLPDLPAGEPKQIVVKIVTDDPNIVIYWLLDGPGAGE